jgi:hypothetical protein
MRAKIGVGRDVSADPEDVALLYAMATAGPSFARENGLLPEGELSESEKKARKQWPHLVK